MQIEQLLEPRSSQIASMTQRDDRCALISPSVCAAAAAHDVILMPRETLARNRRPEISEPDGTSENRRRRASTRRLAVLRSRQSGQTGGRHFTRALPNQSRWKISKRQTDDACVMAIAWHLVNNAYLSRMQQYPCSG